MIDFTIEKGKLIISAESLTVKAFKAVWDYDKSKTKDKASDILLYVFHLCDITERNPFRDLPEKQKMAYAKKNAFGKQDYKFKGDEGALAEEAIKWYSVLNKNSVLRLSYGVDRKIDQMADFLLDTANDINTLAQFEAQSDEIAKLEKVLIGKKKTDEFVRNQLEKSKIKGGQVLSPLEAGLLD